jgi:WD40-like Beta Propeller Repeat
MTEQLHDLLTRIADQAGPGSADPTLWARARRARRRQRALRASAAALAAAALVGAIAIDLDMRSAPPPADRHTPAPHESGPGIPSTLRGMHGDGGLDPETDLAVGPASVAIANQSGAFVITAADGVYHRLRLPGFDPTAFNENETGLALSPDGTRLAYGWRATKGASGPGVGTRILDLRTGALRKIPAEAGYFPDNTSVRHSTYGYGWSPNGRYLVFETVTTEPGAGFAHWWVGVDTATARFFMFAHEPRDAYCPVVTDCPPMTLVGPRLSARVKEFTDSTEKSLVVTSGAYYVTALPGTARDWAVGRFTPDGDRILLQPDGVGIGLVLVTDHNPRPWEGAGDVTLLRLDPAGWPDGAKIDVLGWVGPDHALARVNRGTGPDTWEPNGELVLVDVSARSPVDPKVVGQVEAGDPGSSYSFATDFATVDAPTQVFEEPSSPQTPDPNRTGAPTTHDRDGGEATRPLPYAAAGLAVLAALTLVLARQRRKRNLKP